jgi:hypothetical protein
MSAIAVTVSPPGGPDTSALARTQASRITTPTSCHPQVRARSLRARRSVSVARVVSW